MTAYYNENNKFSAKWLRNLIAAGHIAQGDVDERDIRDVTPNELFGYTQCHFFAGIAVWSYALRQAGWPDDRLVWTGSCPCQPFSQAGRGEGLIDERHLWPHWFHLIDQRRPGVIFGEQIAARDGLAWLDLVQADLEGADYTVGCNDLCAAGFGAPHRRQRLFFVADTNVRAQHGQQPQDRGVSILAGASGSGPQRSPKPTCSTKSERPWVESEFTGNDATGVVADVEWLPCTDGKSRPVEPGNFPLAAKLPAGMGRLCAGGQRMAAVAGLDAGSLRAAKSHRIGALRGYGNAINAEVAAGFIRAYREVSEGKI